LAYPARSTVFSVRDDILFTNLVFVDLLLIYNI